MFVQHESLRGAQPSAAATATALYCVLPPVLEGISSATLFCVCQSVMAKRQALVEGVYLGGLAMNVDYFTYSLKAHLHVVVTI